MLVGVSIPQTGRLADVATVRAAALAAESLGYSSLWAMDPPPGTGALDPVGVLTVAAAATTCIGLGTSVLAAPSYPGPQLVRAIRTLELASQGRLTVGLGLGAAGRRVVGGAGRVDALESALDLLEAAAPATGTRPRSPVLLAASTSAGFERIASRADGWNPMDPTPDELRAGWAAIRDHAARAGRDPDRLRLVVRVTVDVTHELAAGDRPAGVGSPEQIAEDLRALESAGAQELVLGWRDDPSLDDVLDRCARVTERLEPNGRT